jgi:hypothetical protein
MHNILGFFRRHGSVTFAAGLTLLSFLLILESLRLANDPAHVFLSTLLEHLAAMGVAAVVATVIFAFHDVQESFAATITELLVRGDIARHLSVDARALLRRNFLLESLTPRPAILPISLVERMEAIESFVFTIPHVYNYAVTVTVARDPTRPELLRRSLRCNYTVDARHLKDGRTIFPLRFQQELTDPRHDHRDPIINFSLTIDKQTFTREDVQLIPPTPGGPPVYRLLFAADVPVMGEADVSIIEDTILATTDPTEILYARYPTKGFRASLFFTPELTYDAVWFRSATEVEWRPPGRGEAVTHLNGIEVFTNDWLLPGHGVVLFWFPTAPGAGGPSTFATASDAPQLQAGMA